nr:keratin-associated protein 10-6-like [Penaeus vannamei]
MMRFLCLTSVMRKTVLVVSKRSASKANAAIMPEGDATGLAAMEKLQKKVFVLETAFAASKTSAQSPKCQALDGRCVESCEADELAVPWLCGGENCTCCVKNNCNQTKCCEAFGGSCGKMCYEGEEPIEGVCEGACQCCAKAPCEQSNCCNVLGGRCNATCGRGERAVEGVCHGEHCLCCVPDEPTTCPDSTMCRDVGGRCDVSCGGDEQVLEGVECRGGGCVCCVQGEARRGF